MLMQDPSALVRDEKRFKVAMKAYLQLQVTFSAVSAAEPAMQTQMQIVSTNKNFSSHRLLACSIVSLLNSLQRELGRRGNRHTRLLRLLRLWPVNNFAFDKTNIFQEAMKPHFEDFNKV